MGGNGAVIVQILGVLLILFFFFLTYMFTKTWRWHHVMFAFLIFPATLTFAIYAAMTLKTHSAWQAKHDEIKKQLETELAAVEKLKEGAPTAAGGPNKTILELKGELSRLLLDRGRVWRQTTPTNGQLVQTPSGVRPQAQLTTVPPNATEPTPHGLQPNDTVYVFAEAATPDGRAVPDVYLGQYRVVATPSETEVTIQGESEPDAVQRQVLQQGGATWALYEVMPRDSHYSFTAAEPDDDHMYGLVDDAAVRGLFRNRYGLPPDMQEEIVQSYLRDGGDLQADDPPETRWAKVKFLQSYDLQIDAIAPAGVLEGDYFDSSGRAEDRRLWSSETGDQVLKFKKDDIGFFPEIEANKLVDQGIASIEAPVFSRTLRDYAYMFWKAEEQRIDLQRAIYLVDREIASMQVTIADAQETITKREGEVDKLASDLQKFEVERDEMKNYHDVLVAHWKSFQGRANKAFQDNLVLEQQLEEASRQLTEQINRRTSEVTSTQ